MRFIAKMWIILMLGAVCSLSAQEDFLVYKAKSGKIVTVSQLAKQIVKKQVVFFGEYHDDKVCHTLEIELLEAIYKVNPRIIVSFEMFERDVQEILNQYLSGKIDEKEFLATSRPWPNYETDYKPILEFARMHKLPVIATNVPRKYAGMVAKGGVDALKDLPQAQRSEFANKLVVLDDKYRYEFMKTMNQNMSHGMPGGNQMLENIYSAQCLKDDTMAESINLKLINSPKNTLVIHYNGDFHSRFGLGTALKLKLMNNKAKIAVISPEYIESGQPLTWDRNLEDAGDYIIMIPKDITPEMDENK